MEATPVVFGQNTVTAVPKEWIQNQNQKWKKNSRTYRDKRDYNIDDFLLYMPSGKIIVMHKAVA